MEEGQEGSLTESQTPQNQNQLQNDDEYFPPQLSVYSTQYNQGQWDQYPLGHHWLAGPSNFVMSHGSPDHSFNTNNYVNMGFGGRYLPHLGYNFMRGGGMMTPLPSTIHHMGPKQQLVQQHQLSSSSSAPSYHQQQGQLSMPPSSSSSYSAAGTFNSYPSTGLINNNVNIRVPSMPLASLSSYSAAGTFDSYPSTGGINNHINTHVPPSYLSPACNNYRPHPYRQHVHDPTSGGGGRGASPKICHHRGQTVMGPPTPSPPAAAVTTKKRVKVKKASATATSTSVVSRNSRQPSSETLSYGGLEVLWRQIPDACRKLFRIQDVPDKVKVRGHFMVCELLELKRTLMERLNTLECLEVLPSHEEGLEVAVRRLMGPLPLADTQSYCSLSAPEERGTKREFPFKTITNRVMFPKVIDRLSLDKTEIGDNLGMDARDEVKSVTAIHQFDKLL